MLYLIEILHQTTTAGEWYVNVILLYLIEILHQTTTPNNRTRDELLLYLIEILHQTTTFHTIVPSAFSCILSKFYIKPQPISFGSSVLHVVSYRNSTSNHNDGSRNTKNQSVVSYRNSTSNHNLMFCCMLQSMVVSYRNSTSNHNGMIFRTSPSVLYLIEILHQTTTATYRSISTAVVVSYRNSTSNHNVGPHID